MCKGAAEVSPEGEPVGDGKGDAAKNSVLYGMKAIVRLGTSSRRHCSVGAASPRPRQWFMWRLRGRSEYVVVSEHVSYPTRHQYMRGVHRAHHTLLNPLRQVGKSTVLAALADRFAQDSRVVVLLEAVDVWRNAGLLQAMYAGTLPKLAFQLVALVSGAAPLLEALHRPGVRVVVTEGSPSSNRRVYAAVGLCGDDKAAYNVAHNALTAAMPARCESTVLLDASVEVAQERIALRGRAEEQGLPASYLEAFHQAREAMFASITHDKYRLDASCTPHEVATALGAIVEGLAEHGWPLPTPIARVPRGVVTHMQRMAHRSRCPVRVAAGAIDEMNAHLLALEAAAPRGWTGGGSKHTNDGVLCGFHRAGREARARRRPRKSGRVNQRSHCLAAGCEAVELPLLCGGGVVRSPAADGGEPSSVVYARCIEVISARLRKTGARPPDHHLVKAAVALACDPSLKPTEAWWNAHNVSAGGARARVRGYMRRIVEERLLTAQQEARPPSSSPRTYFSEGNSYPFLVTSKCLRNEGYDAFQQRVKPGVVYLRVWKVGTKFLTLNFSKDDSEPDLLRFSLAGAYTMAMAAANALEQQSALPQAPSSSPQLPLPLPLPPQLPPLGSALVEDSAHIEDVISDLEAQRDAMVEDMNNRIVHAKVRREDISYKRMMAAYGALGCNDVTGGGGISMPLLRGAGDAACDGAPARALRPRANWRASGAALPEAPSVAFYQGHAHGGSRLAECSWIAWMHVDRGAFADAWVSSAERARMPSHLGVIVTYIDVRGEWHPVSVATESATQLGQWGYYCARQFGGGEYIGAMLDAAAPDRPSRYLIKLRGGVRDGAASRPGGPRCANDPRGSGLPANAKCYDNGWLAVAPFAEIAPLRPDLTLRERRRREVLWDYGDHYWARLQQHLPPPSPPTSPPDIEQPVDGGAVPLGADHAALSGSVMDGGAALLALRGSGCTKAIGREVASGDVDRLPAEMVHSRNADALARAHPLPGDPHLTFDEATHTYTVYGQAVQRSVTALVGALFEAFDPERCTEQHFERWARDPQSRYHAQIEGAPSLPFSFLSLGLCLCPRPRRCTLTVTLALTRCEDVRERGGSDADAAAAIRRGWEQLGQEASRLGTALHLHAELHANGVVSVTDAPLELQREAEQFGAFLRSKFGARLQALRTELAVAWRAEGGRAVTAGQVDCLYKDSEGCVIMVDFKRVASKHSLEPWARAFGGAYGRPPVELLPDTPFWRYSLQQSLYAVMLKQVRIEAATPMVICMGMSMLRCHWPILPVCVGRRMASTAVTASICCGSMRTATRTSS